MSTLWVILLAVAGAFIVNRLTRCYIRCRLIRGTANGIRKCLEYYADTKSRPGSEQNAAIWRQQIVAARSILICQFGIGAENQMTRLWSDETAKQYQNITMQPYNQFWLP